MRLKTEVRNIRNRNYDAVKGKTRRSNNETKNRKEEYKKRKWIGRKYIRNWRIKIRGTEERQRRSKRRLTV